MAAPADEPRPRPREEHRSRHRREHEDLEVGRLTVLGRERHEREHAQEPGDPRRASAVPAPRLQRDEQRRQRGGSHREHAHGPQVVRAEQLERGGVHVRNERRLAVGRLLVELAAVLDHLGLGGEERLVGVEDVDEERREPQEHGERQDDDDQARDVTATPGTDRLGVPSGGDDLHGLDELSVGGAPLCRVRALPADRSARAPGQSGLRPG